MCILVPDVIDEWESVHEWTTVILHRLSFRNIGTRNGGNYSGVNLCLFFVNAFLKVIYTVHLKQASSHINIIICLLEKKCIAYVLSLISISLKEKSENIKNWYNIDLIVQLTLTEWGTVFFLCPIKSMLLYSLRCIRVILFSFLQRALTDLKPWGYLLNHTRFLLKVKTCTNVCIICCALPIISTLNYTVHYSFVNIIFYFCYSLSLECIFVSLECTYVCNMDKSCVCLWNKVHLCEKSSDEICNLMYTSYWSWSFRGRA